MKNYREHVECCSSCYYVVKGQMGEWRCGLSLSSDMEDPDWDDKVMALVNGDEYMVEPHGKCDGYKSRRAYE